nr:YidB family protein [Bordetella genomosp. 13]
MGLLDSLMTSLASGSGGEGGGLLPAVLKQLGKYPGGIAGLLEAFERGGLGEVVQSWIGNGPNQPITAQQLDSVFEPGVVDAIAADTGRARPDVLESLAGMLPGLVDKATPNGTMDDVKDMNAMAMLGLLSRLMK